MSSPIWVKNLVNSINKIKSNINLIHKLFDIENIQHNRTFYDMENEVLDKNIDINSRIEEIFNLSTNMKKTPIMNISRFTNQNLTELDINQVIDNIPGVFNNELMLQKYEINLKKDIRINNVTKIFDSNSNVFFNHEDINIINFNTVSKVGRMNVLKDFNNETNSISESSYKTCIIGDIICDLEISISTSLEDEWKSEIESLYGNESENVIIPNIKTFPKTHYNNIQINIKDKENTIIFANGILFPERSEG